MRNRDVSAAWSYHDGTKHSPESVQRNAHFLDWEVMPLPFKIYTELEPIPLPRDFEWSTKPAAETIAPPLPQTGASSSLDLKALARLLHFSAGVLRRRTYPGGEAFFRAAACTGNLHHIDLYLICASLPDLEAGVYHFGPHDFALRRLRAGDHRGAVVRATAAEAAIAAAPVIVACTSTFWRNAWKYQARTYRHCFWDNGTVLANLLAAAAAGDTPAEVVLGFVDDELNRLFDLDVEREVTLSLVALGRGADPAPGAPEAPRLGAETRPLSTREVDYPAIRRMHEDSSLGSVEEVETWRSAAVHRPPPPASATVIPLPPGQAGPDPSTPIERVIVRRGSSRAFSHDPIGLDALATIVRQASGEVRADFEAAGNPLTDLYLIANAVDGLRPGTYFFDRHSSALEPLRAGSFRTEAGHLGLGQQLPADAAVNLFWLAELQPILDRFGNRGYRAAQLEAAIGGGRAYLAAYALRLGATGLTFFDDDVTQFFSPHAARKSVMFLVAVGHSSPP